MIVQNAKQMQANAAYRRNRKCLTFSEAVSSAVVQSIRTMGVVCGFIIFFEVFIEILKFYGILQFVAGIISFFGVNFEIAEGIIAGIFEITSGIEALAKISGTLPLIGALLTFSGISVIMQVSVIVHGRGLSIKAFVIGKTIQAFFMAVYVVLLLCFLPSVPTFVEMNQDIVPNFLNISVISTIVMLIGLGVYILISRLVDKRK